MNQRGGYGGKLNSPTKLDLFCEGIVSLRCVCKVTCGNWFSENQQVDNLCKVRGEQEKFGLLGGCVPVTKV